MTSHEQPTGGHGPLQGLASELDRARRRAGITYPEMASRISNGPSAETLEAAASGSSLPSWAVTRAYTDACGASLSVFLLWNKAREASEASFINRVLELHAKAGPPRTGEKRLRDWGTVSRSTVNNMRKRLQKRDAVYPGAVTGERGCPALAHPGTVEKVLEICLDSRDNELFQELEAIKGRRREARAAKESGRKEHRSWSDKPRAGLKMMPPNPAARGRTSTRHRAAGSTSWSRAGA